MSMGVFYRINVNNVLVNPNRLTINNSKASFMEESNSSVLECPDREYCEAQENGVK